MVINACTFKPCVYYRTMGYMLPVINVVTFLFALLLFLVVTLVLHGKLFLIFIACKIYIFEKKQGGENWLFITLVPTVL